MSPSRVERVTGASSSRTRSSFDPAADPRQNRSLEASAPDTARDLEPWAWLWLALAPFVLQLLVRVLDREGGFYERVFVSERGAVEILTAVALLPAAILAWLSARLSRRLGLRACAWLLVAYGAGCLLLMGEELSWGQHWFGWASPQHFQDYNKQGETNLHNLAYLNKALPKWALAAGMLIGGILAPVGARLRGWAYRPSRHWGVWLVPTRICVPAALVGVGLHLFTKLLRVLDVDSQRAFGIILKETVELYMAIFLLLYALSLYLRLSEYSHHPRENLAIGP